MSQVLRGEPFALLEKLSQSDHAFMQHPDSKEALEVREHLLSL